MLLQDWRKSKGLKLAAAAQALGLPVSTLWGIERGTSSPSFATAALIEAATRGLVGLPDLFAGWRGANIQEFKKLRARGRALASIHRSPAQQPKEGKHGNGKIGRQR